MQTPSQVVYAPPGYLLFVRDRTLVAQRFDADALAITRRSDPARRGPRRRRPRARVDLRLDDRRARVPPRAVPRGRRLVWIDRKGQETPGLDQDAQYTDAWLSPDGSRLVFDVGEDNNKGDIWIRDFARGTTTRFTFEPEAEFAPVWSPDGKRIAYSVQRKRWDLYWKDAAGTGEPSCCWRTTKTSTSTDWSRDGRPRASRAAASDELGPLGDARDGRPQALPAPEGRGSSSVNGSALARRQASSRSSRTSRAGTEIYVQEFPEARSKWQVSPSGGREPSWRADGRELYYRAPDARLMAVPVEKGACLQRRERRSRCSRRASRRSTRAASIGRAPTASASWSTSVGPGTHGARRRGAELGGGAGERVPLGSLASRGGARRNPTGVPFAHEASQLTGLGPLDSPACDHRPPSLQPPANPRGRRWAGSISRHGIGRVPAALPTGNARAALVPVRPGARELRRGAEGRRGLRHGRLGRRDGLRASDLDQRDLARAKAALARIAPERESALTARERAHIAAARALFDAPERGPGSEAWLEATERMRVEFPDDDEVALQHALALIGVHGYDKSRQREQSEAGAMALDVLQPRPDHPGAAHYVIHAFDNPEHAILALPAARSYARIAPDASHALHMPSHTFTHLGMWQRGRGFERARVRGVQAEARVLGQTPARIGTGTRTRGWWPPISSSASRPARGSSSKTHGRCLTTEDSPGVQAIGYADIASELPLADRALGRGGGAHGAAPRPGPWRGPDGQRTAGLRRACAGRWRRGEASVRASGAASSRTPCAPRRRSAPAMPRPPKRGPRSIAAVKEQMAPWAKTGRMGRPGQITAAYVAEVKARAALLRQRTAETEKAALEAIAQSVQLADPSPIAGPAFALTLASGWPRRCWPPASRRKRSLNTSAWRGAPEPRIVAAGRGPRRAGGGRCGEGAGALPGSRRVVARCGRGSPHARGGAGGSRRKTRRGPAGRSKPIAAARAASARAPRRCGSGPGGCGPAG